MSDFIDALGAKRVLEPFGALPQGAVCLDSKLPLQSYEIEVEVDMLCLDSTSFRQLVESNDGDVLKIRDQILHIVQRFGKMQNPVTNSGGILTGFVRSVGDEFRNPPEIGSRIVTLASLTLTPLTLDSVGEVNLHSPHVPVQGTAYLPWTVPWAQYSADVQLDAALAAFDVCNAASQTRSLIDEGTQTVVVLGGGNAGLLALAAARDGLSPGGLIVLADADQAVCDRGKGLGLCDVSLRIDRRDAIETFRAFEEAGLPRADITIVVVNAADCEAAAILLTADQGTVLFFSMATSFTKAALGSEGMASSARMLIGSGYSTDRGAYALELLRRDGRLQEALAVSGHR
jgi:L-erythro-3,5-diaminohexanoate dehydrogenase